MWREEDGKRSPQRSETAVKVGLVTHRAQGEIPQGAKGRLESTQRKRGICRRNEVGTVRPARQKQMPDERVETATTWQTKEQSGAPQGVG